MHQFIDKGSVTSVKGFYATGVFCGIKKKKKDLALIYSKYPCTAAGTFTLNKVKAAPLLLSQEVLDKQNTVRAILINSGNANACTGEAGMKDAKIAQKYTALKLGLHNDEVLVSSTGVIGQRMPMDKLLQGIDSIAGQLTEEGGLDAAEAIMTTDTKIKSYAVKVKLNEGEVNIGAVCKGSGMIMPNMATMLAFITTDANIDQSIIKKILLDAVNVSFNRISVDGDTSTNDMVVFMANGSSGININDDNIQQFQQALNAISIEMAKSIVSDGEGATKLVTVNITGAHSVTEADLVGKAVSNSALVKTAIYGEDANWGRIMSAAGNSGADIDPSKMSIMFNNVPVVLPSYNIVLEEEAAKQVLSKPDFNININLNGGKFSSTWWTCDFTEGYIKINASYRS